MGFQIVFNISKIKKPCKLIGQVHFCLQLEKEVLKKCFRQITKTTMVHHLTLKKAHIDGSISFQNIFFPEILAICYFRALWACQTCLTIPKKNFMIKLQLPWISYYMQKANFLPQIVFEILKFKKLSNPIGLEYFQLQLKN